MITLYIIIGYLLLLMGLGVLSGRFFRGTSADYFVASRSIGPFLLLMSVFGTTMTGFALVGSSAKSFESGIGAYGLMASWSGLIHSAVFFLVGIRLWAIGKRRGYVTQVQFFRDRFQSEKFGYVLFAVLVLLVIPYLLVGIIGAARTMVPVTAGMFPETFAMMLPNGNPHPMSGSIPPWLTGLVVCFVVCFYVFFGGVRSAAWANAFQTIVFMVMGVTAFILISRAMGGLAAASEMVLEHSPQNAQREGMLGKLQFASYLFIPLSVGMFPHLFQHWLTAKSAKTFRLTVVAHPIFIMIVWVPCILIGMWASGLAASGELRVANPNAVLGAMVKTLIDSPVLTGLLTAGILAAIMSSLDSQFVCLGSMFTNDIVVRIFGEDHFTDKQKIWLSRIFVVIIVAVSYGLSMLLLDVNVFDLGVWCFTGFASLFPLVFAAIYWRRATALGAWLGLIFMLIVWGGFFYVDIIAEQTTEATMGGEYLFLGMMPVTFTFAAACLGMVLGSLISQPMDREHVEKFFLPREQN